MANDLEIIKNNRKNETRVLGKEAIKLFKKGYALGEICRAGNLDISSVLYLLKRCKYKRTLYIIHQKQAERAESCHAGLFLKKDKYYLEKFFPSSDTDFSSSYYWFWRENYMKSKEKQQNCKHNIRHIRCGVCNKILKDASNIPLEDEVVKTVIDKQNV
jgi:hypothetical protein